MFSVLSTASMLMVIATSYYLQNNKSANDHEKIKAIAEAAGLKTKEGGIRIYRKNKKRGCSEYIYKIPLGLSFKQFEDNKQLFIDGLNNKSQSDFNLANLKNIDWKGDVLTQIRDILNNRIQLDKQIDMSYDGMLNFKVYDKGLETEYPFTDELLTKVKGWQVPIGYTYNDLLIHDFEKRPHMIAAGATGFGKSEFIKLLITVLINKQPNNIRLHLIDLKGGSELGVFKDCNQTINFGRTIKEAKEILESVQKDMESKSEWLFQKGLKDVKAAKQKERDFIFIDEAATLDEDSKDIVVDIARRGRSAGYRLIYATQYPTNETMPSQVRANMGARVCFRLETSTQSKAVLDESGAERLPEVEGRAIFRRVKNYVVQTPHIDEKDFTRLIKPHINIRPKEGSNASSKTKEDGKRRADSLIFEKA